MIFQSIYKEINHILSWKLTMKAAVFKILLLIIINDVRNLNGFYVPGIAPVEFTDDQKIEIKAVKMTSEQYQLPFMYYSLPFCKPKSGNLVYKSENLGEILRGDRIVNTAYEVNMKRNVNCKFLCQSVSNPMHWSQDDSQKVISRIQHEYYIHLLIDNLPAATKIINADTNDVQYENGFRLGFMENDHVYINNHLKITLFYHKHAKDVYRVVRFEVEPMSINFNDIKPNKNACSISENYQPQLINGISGTKLLFTYSVEWQESAIVWASRWDIFLNMDDVQIHWFSIINSIIVLFFLTGVISMILIRTLRKDIARYNSELSIDDTIEETGWKLVHGDVFRPPKNSRLFVAIIGSGIQLFFMALITIFFAMLGMLSPASRGALMTTAIFFYVFMGVVAGYYSARLYKTLRGREWKKAAFLTSSLYPLVVFITIFILNLFIWDKKSSGAVPFSTMLELFALWFFISLPLVYIGYYFGYRKVAFQHPVRTNQIPRQIPDHQFYMHPLISALVAGILPFGAVFIELFFIFTAIWKNQFYYLFGFLFLVFCILVISCSQITIAMIYFQLCAENYNWWWQSLIVSGGSAIYVAIYAVIYFLTKMDITEFIPTIFYFAYTGIMVFTYWLLTSTIGFFSTYFFIRKIYSAVKID